MTHGQWTLNQYKIINQGDKDKIVDDLVARIDELHYALEDDVQVVLEKLHQRIAELEALLEQPFFEPLREKDKWIEELLQRIKELGK